MEIYPLQSLRLLLLLLLSTIKTSIGDARVPQIFWSSNPVRPGETILFGTTRRVAQAQTQISTAKNWTDVRIIGLTDAGFAIDFPQKWSEGTVNVRVRSNESPEWSKIHTVNNPDPWFVFGDGGSYATPGGIVRVIGTNMFYAGTPRLFLRSVRDSTKITLEAIRGAEPYLASTRWHAAFRLPNTIAEGSYAATLDNGASSSSICTFVDENTTCLNTVTVKGPKQWPEDSVFRVQSAQPGFARNATNAFANALGSAKNAGGGIVLVPRGQYFLNGPLILPENTILRGVRRDLVSIYFAEDNATTAPPAYVTGSGKSFGVEGVSIYVTSYANNVVQFSPSTNGAFLRDSRIRFNSYFCLEPVDGQGSRGRNSNWSTAVGTAVKIAGTNVEISGNDIYSSGDVVSTRDNGGAGASYLQVRNNRFWNGGTTHWGISWKQAIYEGNVAVGVSATAMGSNYPQYDHGDGRPHVQNIYHHNNSQTMVWGNDREMMTTDCCGGVYFGKVRPQTESNLTRVDLTGMMAYPQPGGALCVLNGTNAGDCRRVASGGNDNLRWVRLDRPFASPLDETSLITILPFQGHIAFVGNTYSDGGEVQLYGQALGCVMADNTFERTGGLSAWARSTDPAHGWGANQRNQFLNNTVLEGNHVYNYATLPNSASDPSMEAYFPGGSKTIEPWFFGSLTNDQGLPVEARPTANFTNAFNRLIVFRQNRVLSNGGIVVRGTSANVLVEANTVRLSDVGIHVNYSTTQGGIIVVNNTEPEGIPENFNPYRT